MGDETYTQHGQTFKVGSRVMWAYQRKEYAENGPVGYVTALPDADHPDRLTVRLEPFPETQKERAAVRKAEKDGRDLSREINAYGDVSLLTVREACTRTADRLRRVADQYDQIKARFDQFGVPLDDEEH